MTAFEQTSAMLTIFTPTFNRLHTLPRLYESLCRQSSNEFEWLIIDDGSTDGTEEWAKRIVNESHFKVTYVKKENGGLHTTYNTAYSVISTELCACVDSDDWLVDDAVEQIVVFWNDKTREEQDNHAGIIALNSRTDGSIISGHYPKGMTEVFFNYLYCRRIHCGDAIRIMRTDLMRSVAPLIGFEGEKHFNPVYMFLQVCDEKPIFVLDKVLCVMDYQLGKDSMSERIWLQYLDSPRSFAKLRLLEMQLKRNTILNKFRVCVHYVSSCIVVKDIKWLRKSPLKFLTFLAAPFGMLFYLFVNYKAKKFMNNKVSQEG